MKEKALEPIEQMMLVDMLGLIILKAYRGLVNPVILTAMLDLIN